MHKIFKRVLLLILIFGLSFTAYSQSIFVEADANFLFPADVNFKDGYKSTVFMPFFKGGFKFTKNIYIFAGYGFFSLDGELVKVKSKTESNQNNLIFGAGYEGDLSEQFHYRLELGGSVLSYEEKAFTLKRAIDGSKFALYFGGGFVYDFSKNFYACFNLSYSQAKENYSDDYADVSFKLGGMNTGIGLGLRF